MATRKKVTGPKALKVVATAEGFHGGSAVCAGAVFDFADLADTGDGKITSATVEKSAWLRAYDVSIDGAPKKASGPTKAQIDAHNAAMEEASALDFIEGQKKASGIEQL